MPTPTDDAPQENTHIGAEGELTLPDVVPIIHPQYATGVGKWLNREWIRLHYLMRGVIGTASEWATFIVGAANQYPKVSIVVLTLLTVVAEEKYAEHPILTNLLRYCMSAYDPDAEARIFAEKPAERDPVGHAASQVVTEATHAFLDSSEYQTLKEDIEQDVQLQIQRQAYAAAGMQWDVKRIDTERAALQAVRARRHPDTPPLDPVTGDTPPPVPE